MLPSTPAAVRKIVDMTDRFADLDRPGLSAPALRSALVGGLDGLGRFDLVQETGSTNSDLAAAAARGSTQYPDLSVLVAEHQIAGRGRLDRTWMAPARSALAVSVLLRPQSSGGGALAPVAYPWLSLLAALALVHALEQLAKVPAGIKWPNDVVVKGRKLAGILAQLVPSSGAAVPAVVVGAGLNVSARQEELATSSATSLLLENADTTDRSILLKAYLRSLTDLYRQFCAVDGDADAALRSGKSLQASVSERLVTLGQPVRVELPGATEDLLGTATVLESSGALSVRDRRGADHIVSAGDIIHLRPESF